MSADSEDFNVVAARTTVWHHAAQHIPNERLIAQYPVDGTDAARAIRLTELVGDVMAAIARGYTSLDDELAKVIACATCWSEDLARR
jgi:hypothetical protein